jgi:hypothetical protein
LFPLFLLFFLKKMARKKQATQTYTAAGLHSVMMQ